MSSFLECYNQYSWEDVKASIYAKTEADVVLALEKKSNDLEDFKALISPAAEPYLEAMAQKSQRITRKRFGNTMQLYIPLYLSNECTNVCTYCGFRANNKIPRRTLTPAEIVTEAKAVKAMGFDHVLLVTGEANGRVNAAYFKEAIELIKPYFSHISLEVQPLDTNEYETLIEAGLNTVMVYQETYNQDNYGQYHIYGKKSDFTYRLQTADRLGEAGIYKVGLGALLGLEDWRTDSYFTALHLAYLERKYWQTKYSISFPRLRPFAGEFIPKVHLSDRELVQLICAYRIYNEEVELSLSTRETEYFRDNVMKLGVTNISAASKTNPGGYAVAPQTLKQFEIADNRSVSDVVSSIKNNKLEVVWKDWDRVYNS